MNLKQQPEIVQWPETHFVYIEKIGPFQEIAQKCWQELHHLAPEVSKNNSIQGFMSLYKIQPQMIYRAGGILKDAPKNLPAGLQYVKFEGGRYTHFVLTGSYTQLPEACGRVFKMVEEQRLTQRPAFYIEHYVNDPKTTPEEKLVTEILIPTV
jgi:DNA gyrase inhibitor GyrI